MGADKLIGFWSELKRDETHSQRRIIHPQDTKYLDQKPKDFETELVPIPWSGSLRTAKVFVLLLNPGLSPGDIPYEEEHPEFVNELWQNLQGSSPYIYLRKLFRNHPGGGWARSHFGDDITEEDGSKFCVLQLVPYHSPSGNVATKAAKKLPSSQAMKSFVDTLVRDCRPLIVVRGARAFGLHDRADTDTLIVLKGGEPRFANLRKNSKAGRFLRKALTCSPSLPPAP